MSPKCARHQNSTRRPPERHIKSKSVAGKGKKARNFGRSGRGGSGGRGRGEETDFGQSRLWPKPTLAKVKVLDVGNQLFGFFLIVFCVF